jgi:WhiB family redox-sensing transcriptional regulator
VRSPAPEGVTGPCAQGFEATRPGYAAAMARIVAALRPISDAWEWQAIGRCRDRSGTQFFHPDDDLGRISRRLREAAAKRLCHTCPVRAECATHALTVGEEYGVWGGFSETERTMLRELGWQDTLDHRRLVDVGKLERRIERARTRAALAKKRAADALTSRHGGASGSGMS